MVKEKSEQVRKDVPYGVLMRQAVLCRDFKLAGKVLKKKYSVEAYNGKNFRLMPDTIGITIFYPSPEFCTHMIAKEFDAGMDEKTFAREVKKLEKELEKKIPKEK